MEISIVFNLLDKSANMFNQIESNMTRFSKKIGGIQERLQKFNQSAKIFDKLGASTTQITTPFIEFEQSMADLSAITGVANSDLVALGKIAREVGISSGLGATGAVDAFKLLASQMDVSKIGMEGLIELQSKTITLAQASGMSLADAANSMAGTINQFGLDASEASRVINVLAAGSKYGSAEIPELAMSFKAVGAAANAAGLSVEQTAGAIEVLSKSNLKGSEAGTALRNIMLKMQTSMGVDFHNTTLTEELDKLRPKLRDLTYLSSLFGTENVTAAQFLIANADAVKEMTYKVTNTSVATEQAALSTDTWSHRLKTQTARFNEMFISIAESGQGILGAIQVTSQLSSIFMSFSPLFSAATTGIKTIGNGLSGVNRVVKASKALNGAMRAGDVAAYASAIKEYGIAGRIASAGIWMKNIAVRAFSIISRAAIPALIGMVAQTWAWTTALLANPITWVVVGIVALIAAVVICWQKFAEFRAGVLTAWDVIKGFGTAILEGITAPFRIAIETIGGVVKALKALMSGDFSGAWSAIKESMSNNIDIALKPYGTVVNSVVSIKERYNAHFQDESAKEKSPYTDNFKNGAPLSIGSPIFKPTVQKPLQKQDKEVSKDKLPLPSFAIGGYDNSQNLSTVMNKNSVIDTTKIDDVTTNFENRNSRSSQIVKVDYAPIINISTDMTQKSKDDLMTTLRIHAAEVTRIVKDEMRKDDRTTYSYGIS